MKNNQTYEASKVTSCDIWEKVEEHIDKFMEENGDKPFIANAKFEGWLGDRIKKSNRGLLGYLRTGFSIQLKILGHSKEPLPIYQSDFIGFFSSDFFRNAARENGYVKAIYKKEHFEIIKKNKC
tara:strand:+ start:2270 stop:2641 length:372 start_codon:yes stop_codon:yes gene_type:complete